MALADEINKAVGAWLKGAGDITERTQKFSREAGLTIPGPGGTEIPGIIGVGGGVRLTGRRAAIAAADTAQESIERLHELALRNPQFARSIGVKTAGEAVRKFSFGNIMKSLGKSLGLSVPPVLLGYFLMLNWFGADNVNTQLSMRAKHVRDLWNSGIYTREEAIKIMREEILPVIQDPVLFDQADTITRQTIADYAAEIGQGTPTSFARATPQESFEKGRQEALGFQRGTAEGQAERAVEAIPQALETRNLTVQQIEQRTGLPRTEFATDKGRALLRKQGLDVPLQEAEAALSSVVSAKRAAVRRKEEEQPFTPAAGNIRAPAGGFTQAAFTPAAKAVEQALGPPSLDLRNLPVELVSRRLRKLKEKGG